MALSVDRPEDKKELLRILEVLPQAKEREVQKDFFHLEGFAMLLRDIVATGAGLSINLSGKVLALVEADCDLLVREERLVVAMLDLMQRKVPFSAVLGAYPFPPPAVAVRSGPLLPGCLRDPSLPTCMVVGGRRGFHHGGLATKPYEDVVKHGRCDNKSCKVEVCLNFYLAKVDKAGGQRQGRPRTDGYDEYLAGLSLQESWLKNQAQEPIFHVALRGGTVFTVGKDAIQVFPSITKSQMRQWLSGKQSINMMETGAEEAQDEENQEVDGLSSDSASTEVSSIDGAPPNAKAKKDNTSQKKRTASEPAETDSKLPRKVAQPGAKVGSSSPRGRGRGKGRGRGRGRGQGRGSEVRAAPMPEPAASVAEPTASVAEPAAVLGNGPMGKPAAWPGQDDQLQEVPEHGPGPPRSLPRSPTRAGGGGGGRGRGGAGRGGAGRGSEGGGVGMPAASVAGPEAVLDERPMVEPAPADTPPVGGGAGPGDGPPWESSVDAHFLPEGREPLVIESSSQVGASARIQPCCRLGMVKLCNRLALVVIPILQGFMTGHRQVKS